MKVKRTAEALQADKLVIEHRGAWIISPKGQQELNAQDAAKPSQTAVTLPPLPNHQNPPRHTL